MGRFWLACRALWVVLWNAAAAKAVEEAIDHPKLLSGNVEAETPQAAKAAPVRPATPAAPKRSEAVSLVAALQREARFVDLVKEPLDSYSDEQIGAAARNVLRDCGGVLDRFFALRPVAAQAEGESIEVAAGYDPARYRVLGNVAGAPPFRGKVVHCGWEATTVNLPAWTGTNDAARVVAPVEVEL